MLGLQFGALARADVEEAQRRNAQHVLKQNETITAYFGHKEQSYGIVVRKWLRLEGRKAENQRRIQILQTEDK